MKQVVDPKELVKRAKRIGASVGAIAADAGVHRSTIYRAVDDYRNTTIGHLENFSAALVTRELALRDYLLQLHPLVVPALQHEGRAGK